MSLKLWFWTCTAADSAGSAAVAGERLAQALAVASITIREAWMRKDMAVPGDDGESGPRVGPYRGEFGPAFDAVNREWIDRYFKLEPADREILGDPRGKIIDPGGEVFFVVERGEILGTCAMLRHGAEEYEIAKMAVAAKARGRGFGDLLMDACIAFAREREARRVIIVSNTVLEPAIRLYRKHGFVQVPLAGDARYKRANIPLEMQLQPRGRVSHHEATAQ